MPLLSWLNDEEARVAATRVPYRILEEEPKLSYGDESTNMLIQGDNLDALKALLPYYAGQVKCTYIDPPFNTKQAFDHYDDNLEHSIWLSLMYPRLEILRDLMSEDGTIFVHIDDNELAYVTVMLDELFGRNNRAYVVTFKQGSATGHKAINPGMVNVANYILVYCKNKNKWSPNKLFTERGRDSRYGQFIKNYEEHYSKWELIPLNEAFSLKLGIEKRKLKKELGEKYEHMINDFVIENSHIVVQPVRPDYNNVGEDVRKTIDISKENPSEVFLLERLEHPNMYFKGGQRWIFYKSKLKDIDGKLVAGEPLTNLWSDILSNNLHNEGGVKFPKSKKPEYLIKRILELVTNEGDYVLDSFLGSGTTAAVAHKMRRNYIGIELGEHAESHCIKRLKDVVDGDESGVSKAVNWGGGGGFRFLRLGEAVFDSEGHINPNIKYAPLAAHVWFSETGIPYKGKAKSPFLGIHDGVAYGLLYNGILGDKAVNGGNVLTRHIFKDLVEASDGFKGSWVIYGESSRITPAKLEEQNIMFKQTPYDIKAR